MSESDLVVTFDHPESTGVAVSGTIVRQSDGATARFYHITPRHTTTPQTHDAIRMALQATAANPVMLCAR